MIAQARITSDTSATVHFAEDVLELRGADLPEVRTLVKQAFITASREADSAIDVVIVEPDVQHHLRVEPTGRISGRAPDDRPLYGPAAGAPLVAPPVGAHAGTPADPADENDTIDLSSLSSGGHHSAGTFSAGSAPTGEHAVIGADAGSDSARSQRARRRRAAAQPSLAPTGPAADTSDADASDSPTGSGSDSSHEAWAPRTSARSAGSAPSVSSAPSAASAESVASGGSAPSARSAPSAASAPSASAAPSAGSAASAPSATTGPIPRTAAPTPGTDTSAPSPRRAPVGADAPVRPNPLTPVAPREDQRPTLQDLQSQTSKPKKVKATRGLPGAITRLTRGKISPRPNKAERYDNERLERIRRQLDGPRNIAVVNLKGGAHKTTASLMIAATLGVTRGGNVLAWDNNETRGTLGWRGIPTDHHRTVVDLLGSIDSLKTPDASNAELDPFVRPQGEMRFDILASDEDPGSMAEIDETAFADLNDALSRFYRIKVIDTGNNVRASNWLAAVRSADQLVIISTVREDTFNAAAWMIDELRATGLAAQVDHAVTILSHSSKGKFDPTLRKRLMAHFGAHTRAVAEVPYEQQFVDGTHLDWSRVHPRTKDAWLDATALIVDGL